MSVTEALVKLLDEGGASLGSAADQLGLTEGQALAALVTTGRVTALEGEAALSAVRTWGKVRVILRSRGSVAEVMSDLSAVRERGAWWNDEDDRCHLHLDVRRVKGAFVTTKVGHASGRTVRMVSFVDDSGEVVFKVMVPKERTDLIPAFNALRPGREQEAT